MFCTFSETPIFKVSENLLSTELSIIQYHEGLKSFPEYEDFYLTTVRNYGVDKSLLNKIPNGTFRAFC